MAKIYADLIKKGLKTIDDVPESLKDEVQKILDGEIQKGGLQHGSSICNTYHQRCEDN